jgi:hypothetical protein
MRGAGFGTRQPRGDHHVSLMNRDLTEDETAALSVSSATLSTTIAIRWARTPWLLKEILGKLRPAGATSGCAGAEGLRAAVERAIWSATLAAPRSASAPPALEKPSGSIVACNKS